MERRIEQEIWEALLPADIKTILSRQFGLTRHQISSAKFRRNGICLNGMPCKVNTQVHAGDRVSVLLEEEAGKVTYVLPADMDYETAASLILYEDEDLLILNKPAGMAIHPAHGHYQDTLANLVAALYQKEGIHTKPRPVGRLDLETSGVCVFAKNAVAAARLSEQSGRKKELKKPLTMRKTYLALAGGHFPDFIEGASFLIDKPLQKVSGELNRMETLDGPKGKTAVTICTFLLETENDTLLKVEILTGRTHQIRAHLASIGHALVGDRIYGGKSSEHAARNEHVMLHCASVELTHPISGRYLFVKAPLPERFLVFSDIICYDSSQRTCLESTLEHVQQNTSEHVQPNVSEQVHQK